MPQSSPASNELLGGRKSLLAGRPSQRAKAHEENSLCNLPMNVNCHSYAAVICAQRAVPSARPSSRAFLLGHRGRFPTDLVLR